MVIWFKYIVPAQNEAENLVMLGGFKGNAPKEVYKGLMRMLQGVMPAERYRLLRMKLGDMAFAGN